MARVSTVGASRGTARAGGEYSGCERGRGKVERRRNTEHHNWPETLEGSIPCTGNGGSGPRRVLCLAASGEPVGLESLCEQTACRSRAR